MVSPVSEDGPEEIQVLTVKGNKIYLPREVRATFNLHDGDRLVIYDDDGKISMKILRKSKTSRSA